MRLKTAGMALLLSASLAAGLAGTASAERAPGTGFGSSTSEVATAPGTKTDITTKYSDEEVVALMVFGSGRAAQDRPDLAKIFQNNAINGEVSDEVVSQLTDQLRGVDPNFHSQVTQNAQAGDAIKAQSALKRLTDDLRILSEQQLDQNPQARGWVTASVAAWSHVSIVTAAVGVAWAVGIVVLLYSFEDNQTALDAQNMAASLAESL